MKKHLQTIVYVIFLAHLLQAQVTSPTFDPVWAARFQNAINTALPGTPVHGVSVAITFPGMGTFVGVGGESAPGIPITPGMQFSIGSCTKTFTAALALKLQELGILSLDDRLSDWLPAYPNVDGSATLRQCLKHQSGISNYTEDFNPNEPEFVYANTFYTPQQVISRLGPPTFPVGKGFRYSNANYNLVALAMEAASGKTYTELLHQYIFDPLDMDSTFLAVYESPNGAVAHGWYFGDDLGTTPPVSELSIYWAAGAIYSTANEMVQWFDNLFAGNIINQSSLDQMTDFEPSSLYGLGANSQNPPGFEDDEVDGHNGGTAGYGCVMGYDVKRRSSLCILMNRGGEVDDLATNLIVSIVKEVYNGYTRRPDDAGIKNIISPVSERCNGSLSFEVLLQNFGSANLQSVKINYQVDNGSINTYNWTGNLSNDQTIAVTLPLVAVDAGYHSFRSFTSGPNGNSEGYDFNDEAGSTFNINGGVPPNSIHEGFEGVFPPPGWINRKNNILDWGKTTLVSMNGSGCAVKENMDDYSGRSYDLELPLTNISTMKDPVLSFNYAYSVLQGHADGLSVLISKNCGASYTSLFDRTGSALKTCNSTDIFFPKQNEWGLRTLDLSAYKGEVLIKFRAKTDHGTNLYLDNVNISDVTDLCAAPTDLNELQITSSSVKLNWKFQGNANHFDVYYHPKTSVSWSHKTVAGNKQWTDVSALSPGIDYEWYITATCTSANSIASPYSFFATKAALTQKAETLPETNETFGNNLRVTPNPVSSSALISFSLSQPGKVSVKVYDLNGKLVSTMAEGNMSEGIHQLRWETKNVASGIYFLKMQTAGTIETKKLIVIK